MIRSDSTKYIILLLNTTYISIICHRIYHVKLSNIVVFMLDCLSQHLYCDIVKNTNFLCFKTKKPL